MSDEKALENEYEYFFKRKFWEPLKIGWKT